MHAHLANSSPVVRAPFTPEGVQTACGHSAQRKTASINARLPPAVLARAQPGAMLTRVSAAERLPAIQCLTNQWLLTSHCDSAPQMPQMATKHNLAKSSQRAAMYAVQAVPLVGPQLSHIVVLS